ncbi:MAG: T9SS type A sorting domain-containing protein [Candidatus Marinimicrobia bacterium]|nr:T9SS type A sorting domain-containing protein [Candidatus Neomarinimicrobiota bacterium]
MLKKLSIIIILNVITIPFTGSLRSQSPDTLWTKTYGGSSWDYGRCVQQTNDVGYIITGFMSWSINFGLSLIKTDEYGDTTWSAGIESGEGYCVQQTYDGGYIVIGKRNGVLLYKTNEYGETQWLKEIFEFTSMGDIHGRGYWGQETSDGFIITGEIQLYEPNGWDLLLIKTDFYGDTLWTRIYGRTSVDRGTYVQKTSDGGYIIVGTTAYYPKSFDIWLLKTDEFGDTLWTKTFGGYEYDFGESGQQTSDGGYIIVGRTTSYGAGRYDIWLIKTDEYGDTLWTKTYGGSELDRGYSVLQTSDGGYIIAGSTESYGSGESDAWIIKTDAQGDTLWTKILGGVDFDLAYSIQQTTDGGYIISGHKDASEGLYFGDLWLIRLAPDSGLYINDSQKSLPEDFALYQNYPNPFNLETSIEYQIPESRYVTLKIYNIAGQEVITLVNEHQNQGRYIVKLNGKNRERIMQSGLFLYRIEAGEYHQVKKLMLLK